MAQLKLFSHRSTEYDNAKTIARLQKENMELKKELERIKNEKTK